MEINNIDDLGMNYISSNNNNDNKDNTGTKSTRHNYEYNEDDEFVYGKKDQTLNLDQELQKRQFGEKGQNINYKDHQKIDPDMERKIREQPSS